MSSFWKNLKKPITVLAPMEDVTDYVFREIVAEIAKPDVLFTEFTSTDALFTGAHEITLMRLEYSDKQKPIAAQIWGYLPANFKKTAQLVQKLGFQGIDINMGCPDKSVMKRGAGAALINNQELVKEIINETREGAPEIALSVKTRIDNTPKTTETWFRFLLSQNIDALTIHGRTAKAMSKGSANWDEISKAVKIRNEMKKNTIIIGNGDVKSYDGVLEKYKTYGVEGVMMGRGIFQNPWLFDKNSEAKKHSNQEYINLLLKHAELFNKKWGNNKNFAIMKKFFKIYVKEFKGSRNLRQRLMETKNYEEFLSVMGSTKF